MPVEILNVDAAIMFADIMLPLEGMGVELTIEEGLGPIIKRPIENVHDVERLGDFEPRSDVDFVLEGIGLTKKRLEGRVPLIGFCGAPFTLASYLIEGRPSRDFAKTKALMYRDTKTWNALMQTLAINMTKYLQAQIQAGVDAVQIFDSWAGCLSPQDYRRFVLPYSQRIFQGLADSGVPRIHFGTGTSNLLPDMRRAGGDVFGVDWRISIDSAWERLGHDVAIQGNLDPAVLLGDLDLIRSQAADILKRVEGQMGYIFNLGHGMLPNAPVKNVIELVEYVHKATQQSPANK